VQAHAQMRARPVVACSDTFWASSWVRMGNDRASSRRAIATVAMLVPRRGASWPSALANMGWRLAVWAASSQDPPHPRRTLLGDVAVAEGAVGVAHLGGETGPGAQLAGGGEAADVADLGDQGHRGELADAGQGLKRLDPWVGLGQRGDLAFQPADRVARASSNPQQSWMIPRGIGGSSRSASHARPGLVQGPGPRRCHGRPAPRAPGSSARSTAGPGWPGGVAGPADRGPAAARSRPGGSTSARSSCAHVPASTLSSLQPGRGDRLAAAGMDQGRVSPSSSSSPTSQPQP
jgi:hypothetical protein